MVFLPMPPLPPLPRSDLWIHLVVLSLQLGMYIAFGPGLHDATPAWVYPGVFILASINLFRLNERIPDFGTRLVLLPHAIACFLILFCLINEIGAVFWAFYTPRWFGVPVRIVWAQALLLLLHPQMFPPVRETIGQAFAFLRSRNYFQSKIIVILSMAGMALWLLRSQNISPDGYDWLKHSVYPKDWVHYLREPLGTFLFRVWVYWGMEWYRLEPYISLTVLIIACGLITTVLLVQVLRSLLAPEEVGLATALLLGSYGYTQIFVGNIEIYALLHTAFVVFLWISIRYLRQGASAAWVGVIFGVMFCVHLSAGWWLPALIALPFLKERTSESPSPWTSFYLKAGSAMAVVLIAFWGFVMVYGYGGNIFAMWNHFWSDQVMRVGTDAAMFRPAQDYVRLDYYMTMLNEYYCMMPGMFLLLPALLVVFRPRRMGNRLDAWFMLLTGFYLVYSLTWRPDRHFPYDWDLFSALTIPMIVNLVMAWSKAPLSPLARHYILYQAAVFSWMYLLLQLLRNHLQATDWPLFI